MVLSNTHACVGDVDFHKTMSIVPFNKLGLKLDIAIGSTSNRVGDNMDDGLLKTLEVTPADCQFMAEMVVNADLPDELREVRVDENNEW